MIEKGVRHYCTCTDIIVDREGGKTLLYMYWYNSMIEKGVRHYCTCTDIIVDREGGKTLLYMYWYNSR